MQSMVEAITIYSPSSVVMSYPASASAIQNIEHWLFPNPPSSPLHFFLVTDSDRVRRYCSSLLFQHHGQPYSLLLVSRSNCFSVHSQILLHLQQVLQGESLVLVMPTQ